LIRARAETKNAPAEPTTASSAVGFSGDVTHPVWAWSGRATKRNKAEQASKKDDLFIVSSNETLRPPKSKVNGNKLLKTLKI
jgi:hypothetical protein